MKYCGQKMSVEEREIDPRRLLEVVNFGGNLKHVLVATTDGNGIPHLSAASSVGLSSDGLLAVRKCYCQKTMDNVRENPLLSVLILNANLACGYQLIGRLQGMGDLADPDMLLAAMSRTNGRLAEALHVDAEFLVKVMQILDFEHVAESMPVG